MCSIDDENLEHLFFLCLFAMAIWFGTDLSIRIDEMALYSIKDWIQEWLLKPKLTQPEAFWFMANLSIPYSAYGITETR